MEFNQLYLLSTYLKKWSYAESKISLNYSFTSAYGYERHRIDMRISSPANMINEILNNVFYRAKERIREELEKNPDKPADAGFINIALVNESEVKRKLSVFLTKILKEFNQNKKSHGRSRMISTRSLDFYYNDFEFEPLPDEIKFFVHMNRGVNKMQGDLWSNAVDDFKLALNIKPDDVDCNRHIAEAYNKLGKHDQALTHLKVQAESESSEENLSALALAHIQVGAFKEAEAIFGKIEKNNPDSFTALFGRAQLAYIQQKPYKRFLDKIYKLQPDLLRQKLGSDWDYRLPYYIDKEELKWNAATAARYLGLDRPFDLTRKAFNNELPSYFDADKGTIRFVKDELDHWVEIMNRYNVDGNAYTVFEDRLSKEELAKAGKSGRRSRSVKKNEVKAVAG